MSTCSTSTSEIISLPKKKRLQKSVKVKGLKGLHFTKVQTSKKEGKIYRLCRSKMGPHRIYPRNRPRRVYSKGLFITIGILCNFLFIALKKNIGYYLK